MSADYSSYVEGWRGHLAREREEGEVARQRALSEARRLARFLGETGRATRVVGIGSAFERYAFGHRSDLDLVVFGLPESCYFSTLGEVSRMTRFDVDLIPYESASPLMKERAGEGVPLWP